LSQLPPTLFQNSLEELNKEIQSRESYSFRRNVPKTKVLFYDDLSEALPEFKNSPLGWCLIPYEMADQLNPNSTTSSIIRYSSEEEEKYLEDSNFLEECTSEIPQYLISLATIYLKFKKKLSNEIRQNIREKLYAKINEIEIVLKLEPRKIIHNSNMISSMNDELKKIENGIEHRQEKTSENLTIFELIKKIMEKRREGTTTVKEICDEFRISQSTYYAYCRKANKNKLSDIKPRGRPVDKNGLHDDEKEYIKCLADDSKHCYTVSQMRVKLNSRFGRQIQKNRIYRYLTKGLAYSYKCNTYAAPAAFEPSQKVIRYKVSKVLIDAYTQGQTVIYFDETGCDLNICSNRSWSKHGLRPYRMRPPRSQRLNLIMAITDAKILAFQVIKGSMNENIFIDFMIGICRKLSSEDNQAKNHYIFYMDNHRTHCSNISMKLLKILGFKIVFSPVAYYQLNPIELLFGIIKRNLKTKLYTDL